MLKRNKRKQILAAVLSAAFCIGGYGFAEAYTYSGVTSTINDVTKDANDLIITGGSKITVNSDLNAQTQKTIQTTGGWTGDIQLHYAYMVYSGGLQYEKGEGVWIGGWFFRNDYIEATKEETSPTISANSSAEEIAKFNDFLKRRSTGSIYDSSYYDVAMQVKIVDGKLVFYNPEPSKFGMGQWKHIYFVDTSKIPGNKDNYSDYEDGDTLYCDLNPYIVADLWADEEDDDCWLIEEELGITKGNYIHSGENVINDNASISVLNNSTLISKANIQTSKAILVTGNSLLSAADTITGGTITTDGDIVANSGNADSGDTIRAKKIVSNGLLKSTSGAVETWDGTVSAGSIQTAGRVFGQGSITASGKIKGQSLNVAKVKASSASIGGNVTFSGSTILNGGASANSKKVSSVGKGTANTDLINLGQMNTAFAGAGKTYTAGGNIAINSSNNAISIVKNGTVKSDDTGIVTGATVFDIISGLESSLTLQNTRLTNLSSSIKSKDTSFGTISTSVSGLQSNVNSAVSSLNTKAQSYLRNDFRNISDEGKTRLSNLITSSIKNYKDSLNGVASVSSKNTDGSPSITTLENKGIPTVSALDSGAGNTMDAGAIEAGNTNAVTGGDIYTAWDTKADKDAFNSMLNEKVSTSEFDSIKESVNQNRVDIVGLKDNKAEISSFDTALKGKMDKSDFDTLHSQTMVNREDISSFISSKLNTDGSNLDASAYNTKLANGILEKQNKGLVTGGMVYDALRFTADKDYVDAIGNGLNHTLQETAYSLTKDMNKIAAGAAALAGLHPQDYNEDSKVDFAAGYGHYKDANAVAVGLYYHPNPIAMISLSGTMGNGSPMLNAGLSFKVGYGKHVEKAVVNKADYEALQGQVERLNQMVKALAK